MKDVTVVSKTIPANPRSDNYQAGSTVVRTSGGTTVIAPGGGDSVDILKENDNRSLTDTNVMSSARAVAEFISKKNDSSVKAVVDYLNGIKINGESVTRIIQKATEVDEYSDSDIMSALRVITELTNHNEELKNLFLSKTTDDRTDYSLEIGKDLTVEGILKSLGGIISKGLVKAESGLEVAGGISTDSLAASGDITGKNISASETVSGKNINATKKVSAETVVASGAVKGNYVDAAEDVSGKNVLAAEGVAGKTVTATDTVKGNHVQAVETVSGKNASISNKVTTLNLLVQALADIYDLNVSHVATLFRTIVKDYISSEQFIPGFTGNGMKLYKALNGDWNLELDNLTVRKAMTVFELIISKIRAVNGGLVISPANGKVKSVLLTNGLYRLEIEDDMMFVADDLVRCQSFSVKSGVKYYWVRITSVSGSYIFINATEFTNSLPAIGDDLVQFGNKTNKLRQGLLYLTAAEDGKPRISVLDGVNSTDLTGKTKVILGCLDDIVDSDFSADSQPSGYGLYAQNVFLKGMFILRSGKTVESELDTTNAAVKAAKSVADAAKTAAGTAQTTANTAVTNAATANTLLADLASDNKLTATEKQQTKKEWDTIVSEKVKNDASADKFGVSKTVYGTTYAALNTYITPLLSSLTTTSAITGTEFRDKFKAYYDARTDLLNAVSAKAKTLADTAQSKADSAATAASTAQTKANEAFTAAGSAQTAANNAQTSANGANALLTDIASDNKLTPTEKQATRKEWDIIVSEKPLNNASAVKFGVATTAYDTVYLALNTYITPLISSLTTTTNVTGTDFRAKFKAYYDARTNLLNSISAKAKSLADDAQASVDNLQVGGRNLLPNSNFSKNSLSGWTASADGNYTLSIVNGELKITGKQGRTSTELNNSWNTAWYVSPHSFNEAGDYTLSFEAYALAECTLHFRANYFNYPAYGGSVQIGVTKKKYSIVFKNDRYDSGRLLGFVFSLATALFIDNIQLEIGNKATDWTPAPEDIDAKITTIETNFEIREGQISAKVTEVTTKATQAATSATNAKTSETNASGSATTSGQKATAAANSATAASGSATAAKKSADTAGAILEEVTVKESSITQTAGQIATKVTEVNTKVTEANSAATNAKKSETAAGSSATAASGSASTATTKAGEAATSATNAKASADTATTKLITITEKESSINQTASQISTKVTEVTKKATEAATSATNAAGSATTAGAKAGEAATSATNAKASADSAAAKLTTITQKESSINQTASNITLQVTEVTTKASQASTSADNASNAAELAVAMSQGKMLYRDPSFEKGNNGIAAYNNLSNGAVTVTRVSGIAGNPNGSGYCLKIVTTANASPGWGGWLLAPNVKANQRLVYRFIANIPTGRSLSYARNNAGSGVSEKWLTSTSGTGKWEEYAYVLRCGTSGAFSGCGHFYLTGGATPTVSTPLVWYLAYATIYDVTDAEVDYIADAAGKYTTKTEHSSSITQLSNSIELKVAKTDFNALGNRVSNAETTITQHTGQISLKAAQSDVTALGTRMSSAEAKITPDAIKLTVKSQTDSIAASAASSAVNGLQVGGRNYFKKTTSVSTLTGAPTIDRKHSECVNGVYLVGDKGGTSSVRIGGVITCNGYWTISFEIRGSQSAAVGFGVDFCDCTSFTARTTTNNTWTKLSFTYNVTNASSVYHFIDLCNLTWAYIFIRNIKIEQGNKSTDWTPAPEDIDAKITAVETAFEIREGQISSKVSQATTSATNAKTSETNAATSATTAGQKATAAANSASDAASKLTAITTKETSINQTASQITIQASTVTTKTAEAVNAAELAAAMSKGRMLYRDPTFESGLNGMGGYALVGSIAVVAITGCPNRLAKGMRIIATGWTSATDLRAGGFLFANQSRANAVFVVRLIANIPVGRSIQNYYNSYGAGGTTKWLTSQAGTGKWQEYACKVICGASGTFSTVNHFALTGGVAPTAAAPVTWYVAYATVFDTTDVDDVPTVDEVKAGMTVTANKITIFGKDIVLTGAVTADTIAANAVTSIKIAANSITADKIAANAITAVKIAAGVIDATKINATSIQAAVVTAEKIAALNITTKNLTVTNGAKIGNFLIADGGLYAENTVAIIGMANSSYTTHMSAGQIAIDHPSAGSALIVRGGLCDVTFDVRFFTVHAPYFNAPGVLWAGTINSGGSVGNSWGEGCSVSRADHSQTGHYYVNHNLGHNDYFAVVQPVNNGKQIAHVLLTKNSSQVGFRFTDLKDNWTDCEFSLFLFGRNK